MAAKKATSPTKRQSLSHSGGYEEERFEKPPPIHFKCPICLEVFRCDNNRARCGRPGANRGAFH